MAITRVVAATDFSAEADQALAHGVAIARRHGAALTLVYAEPDESDAHDAISSDAAASELAEVAAEAVAEAGRELARRVAMACADGLDADGVLRHGAPDEVIADVAAELGAELTVIGTHGRTGVKRFFLGSVAERLVKRTPESALVVRGAAPTDGAFTRVLVATDFSDAAMAALRAAITLAAPDAPIDVVHAWQYPFGTWGALAEKTNAFQSIREAIVATAQASADALVREAAALGRTIDVKLQHGAPAGTIADVAEHGDYDLVAVGTHGHRGVRRFLLGSVAEAVVRHARCSVLVAHARPRES